jgi:hypothetical protein
MDAMQREPIPLEKQRANVVGGLIQAARAGRVAERRPPDFVMIAVLPDWTFGLLTSGDVENLIALHNIRAIRHSDLYADEESA